MPSVQRVDERYCGDGYVALIAARAPDVDVVSNVVIPGRVLLKQDDSMELNLAFERHGGSREVSLCVVSQGEVAVFNSDGDIVVAEPVGMCDEGDTVPLVFD